MYTIGTLDNYVFGQLDFTEVRVQEALDNINK